MNLTQKELARLVAYTLHNSQAFSQILNGEPIEQPVSAKQMFEAAKAGVVLAIEAASKQDVTKATALFGIPKSTYRDNVNALRDAGVDTLLGRPSKLTPKPKKVAKPRTKTTPKAKPAVEAVTQLTPEILQKIVEENGMALIFVSSKNCGACRGVSKNFHEVAEGLQKKRGKKPNFYQFKTDDQIELARLFNVRSVPRIIAIKQGVVVFNDMGVRSLAHIMNVMQGMIGLPEGVLGSIISSDDPLKFLVDLHLDHHHRTWP